MEAGVEKAPVTGIEEAASHPAREMSLHLLRMLETRLEAAGIVLQSESQRVVTRLQLHLFAAAAGFIAIWGGIVLLAIALPPNLRIPVLSGVVAAFVLAAVWCVWRANSMIAGREVGSLSWFLDSLKLDLEVLARSLGHHQAQAAPPPPPAEPQPTSERSQVSDAA
jgi:uncharacterized membrane protein YqjE